MLRKIMRKLLASLLARPCAAALVILGTAACASAGDSGAGPAAAARSDSVIPKVTVNFRRVPLERVLDYISRQSRGVNIKIRVDDAATADELSRMLVTVELVDVTWRAAVDYIAEQYKFTVNDDSVEKGFLFLERPPRVIINVRRAKLRDIIALIAMQAGVSLLPDMNVLNYSEDIDLDLRDIPWREALRSIAKTYGFVVVEEPNGIVRVVHPDSIKDVLEVRAVQLKYLQPFGTKYQPQLPKNDYVANSGQSYDPVAAGIGSLEKVLNELRSVDGSISYEARNNMLVIKDTATNIENMIKLIKELDREPLQVKVKVRMITIRDSDADRKGIEWGGEEEGGLTMSVGGGQWATTFPFSAKKSGPGENTSFFGWGDMGALAPVYQTPVGPRPVKNALDQYSSDSGGVYMPSSTTANDPIDTYRLGTLSFERLTATLQVLRHMTNTKVVQAPELIVLDNQEATIHMGDILRYAEFYSDDVGYGYRYAGSVNTGVQLIVIPHICGTDDKVIMEVVPKTEDFDRATDWKTFGSGIGSIQLPQTRSKIVVTKMMLRSRETGVIGGLINEDEGLTLHKVPVLGDLPVIGYMFKKTTKVSSKNNLLIFVTPTILTGRHSDDFQEDLDGVRKLAAGLGMPEDLGGDPE